MKHAKKLASLLLALVMVFAVATTAFAAGNGTITVNNTVSGAEPIPSRLLVHRPMKPTKSTRCWIWS